MNAVKVLPRADWQGSRKSIRMTAGTELKQARVHARLSAKQISDRTKIQLYKIEALENDEYGRLPQGIYLDGIVRAYAHEVGIDAEPMVERVRLERGKLPGDWEVPFAAPIDLGPSGRHDVPVLDDIPVLDRPQGDDPLDSFAAESDLAAAPIARHEYHAPDGFSHPSHVPERPARQRAGFVLPLLVLLAAIGLGTYFYQWASPLGREAAPVTATAESRPGDSSDMATAETAAAPSSTRPTDAPVPFSENVITPDADRRAPSDARTSAVPQDTASISDTSAPPARSNRNAALRPAPRNRRVAPAARSTAPARPERIQTPGSSPDVTGSWRLATQVESSSLARFEGLKLGYEMELEQEGDRVTGTGKKVTENGNGIGPKAQTPVTVSGTIEGDRLTLNFVERGARRPTQGKFVLLVDDEGTLRGRFSSDAARSSGRVEAHRVTRQ
jgi:cytoskeletal protein RodZ